ncbi:hypothetical protein KUH03_29970 [Sphingobacterium sp. E70]|uniref:hypothetical protein n=1 Tax=Sphingobacterium sp. E70 TaxID=2853439 RepID=UPI00211C621C|nr:hypothetical protein [Sphingobacterium sp. E70]ULT23391.1 hypothetical protein KUH03_29970 [Sphingobacterium sp. E70]
MNLINLTYGQPADKYTIGYFNGKDTVIFKEKIQLKQPAPMRSTLMTLNSILEV